MSQHDARFPVLSARLIQSWTARTWQCGGVAAPRPVFLVAAPELVAFQRATLITASWQPHPRVMVAAMAAAARPDRDHRPAAVIVTVRRPVASVASVEDVVGLDLLRRAHAASARVMAASDEMLAGLLRRAH